MANATTHMKSRIKKNADFLKVSSLGEIALGVLEEYMKHTRHNALKRCYVSKVTVTNISAALTICLAPMDSPDARSEVAVLLQGDTVTLIATNRRRAVLPALDEVAEVMRKEIQETVVVYRTLREMEE